MSEFPCSACGAIKRFHRKGCILVNPVKIGSLEPIKVPEMHEVIRSSAEIPKVGEWYVLNFFVPMSFDIAGNRKTYSLHVSMAPVQSFVQHGRDWRVIFDIDHCKDFEVTFDGDLFTKSDKIVKALRDLAKLIEGDQG